MSKIKNNGLEIQAYEKIKKMILSNQLMPGRKIVQERLAADLGISRTPLRSALQMLEAEYLVESIPRRGMIVRAFSNEEIVEIFDCRIALECTAVRLFTQKADQKQIASLKQFFAPFIETNDAINTRAYQKADSQFHDAIINWCGNSFLNKLFNKGNLLLCIDRIGLIRPPTETLSEHLAIIDAIEREDNDQAETLLKNHLLASKTLIIKRINNEQ